MQKINDTPAGETRANPNECEGFVKSVEVTIKACLELVGQLFLHFKQDDTGQYAFATLVLLLKTCFEYVQVLGVGEATIGGLTVFVFTEAGFAAMGGGSSSSSSSSPLSLSF